ncbi:argininosuccinate lyase [Limisphaera ngatamarikiensis]|uniref:Argininosuccinate lyase n=1 Tax=Limisphaera ngatamarikiensis TaxID=1324935 RepID=A0A6M1RUR0_9BACT|nr:argininosuccinate lyase [Limisphaera ngatamarikiensis]NGO39151.1 argininosuccinate lyase [Limisphaera ngatamarikiensis]
MARALPAAPKQPGEAGPGSGLSLLAGSEPAPPGADHEPAGRSCRACFGSDFGLRLRQGAGLVKTKRPSHAPISRSGRFVSGPSEAVARFTESVSFDRRLWAQDIQGSLAHAAMLHKVGLLTRAEYRDIRAGLEAIAGEIRSGHFVWKPELEDVHMNIEAELTRRIPAGAKLHTGRSRNDQVAVDLRLWVRDEIDGLLEDIRTLMRALVRLAGRSTEIWIPGYTHLQRAQPVSAAHHLLAYVEMLERDRSRFRDCRRRLNECPLGSGALAGSTLPLDRAFVARQLGFVDERGRPRVTRNSMDAVSDRDFVVEFCAHAALLAVHLSRLAEDLILWNSAEFGFIRIGDAFTTGSSLMPQKKNPDVAELVRGKAGRVIGNLTALLVLLKGLPLTYNRDLQEDKERLFDTADTVRACTRVLAQMLDEVEFQPDRCAAAVADPNLLATDLVDALVRRGVPFRQAHHLVGAAVARAEQLGCPLPQLPREEWKRIWPEFDPSLLEVFDLARAMERRTLPGSPGPGQVNRELKLWQRRLA